MNPSLLYLIDDDPDDREIFEIAMTQVSPEISLVTAKSGLEALSKFQSDSKFRPDYVFLDLNMPGIHGIECLTEIKKMNLIKDLPVIVYSTSSNPVYINDSKHMGAAHYLIKPTSISKLVQLISAIFENNNLPFLLNS